MNNDYDRDTGYHYANFRPPLHLPILEKCLGRKEKQGNGLDIGCGTGHSSLALAHFCKQVIGVEPSIEMLQKALPHPKVSYQTCITNHATYSSDFFDIITFAGSLFYAKSQAVLNEISRAGKIGCRVVVYDFEIVLDGLLKKLEIKVGEDNAYDHRTDFSGLKTNHLVLLKKRTDKTTITLKTSELSHLILSVKAYRLHLKEKYPECNLHAKLMKVLLRFSDFDVFNFDVNLFYTVYRIENYQK